MEKMLKEFLQKVKKSVTDRLTVVKMLKINLLRFGIIGALLTISGVLVFIAGIIALVDALIKNI